MATPVQDPPSVRKTTGGGPRIGFFSGHWLEAKRIEFGASDYWRCGVPAAELNKNGWDVCLSTCVAARKDGTLQLRDPSGNWREDREIIVLQRWMGEGMADVIRRARACGQVVVNDLDDYYWALPKGHEAAAGTDPRRHEKFNREHYKDTLKASSLVTVSTPWLEKALSRWGAPVHVVRNYINLYGWRNTKPGKHVGWVGAVPWRDSDLSLLRDTVVPWLRARGDTFYHGGHMNSARSARELLGYDRISIEPARPIDTYPFLWDPIRVAVIPLINSTFNSAKSWVKGLESCARGIPFISSDHPEYRSLAVGRIATRPHEWQRHLDELQDEAIWKRESRRCRARAEALSINLNWHHWDSVLREALRCRA